MDALLVPLVLSSVTTGAVLLLSQVAHSLPQDNTRSRGITHSTGAIDACKDRCWIGSKDQFANGRQNVPDCSAARDQAAIAGI